MENKPYQNDSRFLISVFLKWHWQIRNATAKPNDFDRVCLSRVPSSWEFYLFYLWHLSGHFCILFRFAPNEVFFKTRPPWASTARIYRHTVPISTVDEANSLMPYAILSISKLDGTNLDHIDLKKWWNEGGWFACNYVQWCILLELNIKSELLEIELCCVCVYCS